MKRKYYVGPSSGRLLEVPEEISFKRGMFISNNLQTLADFAKRCDCENGYVMCYVSENYKIVEGGILYSNYQFDKSKFVEMPANIEKPFYLNLLWSDRTKNLFKVLPKIIQ